MTTDIGQVRGLLNDTVRDIIDLIGLDATTRLVEHLGGTSFDMPRGSRDSRRLRILQEILGADQSALCWKFTAAPNSTSHVATPPCVPCVTPDSVPKYRARSPPATVRKWRYNCSRPNTASASAVPMTS